MKMKRQIRRLIDWVRGKKVENVVEEEETLLCRNRRDVKGELVTTTIKEIANCNIITVEAGTNGYGGGDSGWGSRTYFRITDEASTDMDVKVSTTDYGTKQVEIMLGGDSELDTFIEALEFAAKTLRQRKDYYTTMEKDELIRKVASRN